MKLTLTDLDLSNPEDIKTLIRLVKASPLNKQDAPQPKKAAKNEKAQDFRKVTKHG